MSVIAQAGALDTGAHVCWSVDSDAAYMDGARSLLTAAAERREKTMLFGPAESRPLAELAGLPAVVADPLVDFLGAHFDPDAMIAMFTKETAEARRDGYRGVAVVADMDWLLPAATPEQTVAFEMRLDRTINELGATVICAYRTSSFDNSVRRSLHSVHPADLGATEPAPFRLLAGEKGSWLLSGELDCSNAETFAAVLTAAASGDRCAINARDLDFIDVSGMRQLARVSMTTRQLSIFNAPPILRRGWDLAGFDAAAPGVHIG